VVGARLNTTSVVVRERLRTGAVGAVLVDFALHALAVDATVRPGSVSVSGSLGGVYLRDRCTSDTVYPDILYGWRPHAVWRLAHSLMLRLAGTGLFL